MARRTLKSVLILGVLVIMFPAATGWSSPVVDGRFDPGEGYTQGFEVMLWVEGGKDQPDIPVEGGQLWLHQEPDGDQDVYLALIQPLTLIDNTYGANSIGWGEEAPSGKNHNFKDLVGSDKAEFEFTVTSGDVVLAFTLDYISETEKGSGIYRSLGVTAKDGDVEIGNPEDILAWGTSLDYNFELYYNPDPSLHPELTTDSPATDENYTPNPTYPDWVFEVIYEVKVDGGLFDSFGSGQVTLVHDSPNKIGKNHVNVEIGDLIGEPVPEPASLGLVSLGLAGLLLRRRSQ